MTWDRTWPYWSQRMLPSHPMRSGRPDVEWRPVEPFESTLEFTHADWGGKVFWLRDLADGVSYPMGAGFTALVPNMVQGRLRGRWEPVKQGTAYRLRFLELPPPPDEHEPWISNLLVAADAAMSGKLHVAEPMARTLVQTLPPIRHQPPPGLTLDTSWRDGFSGGADSYRALFYTRCGALRAAWVGPHQIASVHNQPVGEKGQMRRFDLQHVDHEKRRALYMETIV